MTTILNPFYIQHHEFFTMTTNNSLYLAKNKLLFFPYLLKFFINLKARFRKVLKLTIYLALFSTINLDCKNFAQALIFFLKKICLGGIFADHFHLILCILKNIRSLHHVLSLICASCVDIISTFSNFSNHIF